MIVGLFLSIFMNRFASILVILLDEFVMVVSDQTNTVRRSVRFMACSQYISFLLNKSCFHKVVDIRSK